MKEANGGLMAVKKARESRSLAQVGLHSVCGQLKKDA